MLGGVTILGAAVVSACSPQTTNAQTTPAQSTAAIELRMAMRKLWEDHITYTRNVIISALAGLPDQQAVTERLLRNQDDIGNVFRRRGRRPALHVVAHPHHPSRRSDRRGEGGKSDPACREANGLERQRARDCGLPGWRQHAWDRAELETMLQQHLDLTTGEVVGRLGADWAADIRSYDEGHDHMLMFADKLTDGIVAMFAERFT
jgi:hypothetical protein